jgi:hypothetical protein
VAAEGEVQLPTLLQETPCRDRTTSMFDMLVHADWSTNARKKWMTSAERIPQGWLITAPRLVPSASDFMDQWLFSDRTVLVGFDFPIGVPAAFGRRTGFDHFPEALTKFGIGEWASFFVIADRPEDIP